MTRHAKHRRVFYIEEPIIGAYPEARMNVSVRDSLRKQNRQIDRELGSKNGLYVVVPEIPSELPADSLNETLQLLINDLIKQFKIKDFTSWYYTPMAISYTRHLSPRRAIYDCMDELSKFKGAPSEIQDLEKELFKNVDLVFTGGRSLYEVKSLKHPNVYLFPSSIDFAHFSQARFSHTDPIDQKAIAHPRFGFYGVIDERADLNLISAIAQLRPKWQFVLLGPIFKIDHSELPKFRNIHYLGMKEYNELPNYLANWDVAFMPFALNESTLYISPTKTPEYLAAGKPVISTPIRDVIRPYGEKKMVQIVSNANAFVEAGEKLLKLKFSDRKEWLKNVDNFLAASSWDTTFNKMLSLETFSEFHSVKEKLLFPNRELRL